MTQSQPALWADRVASCSTAEKAAGACAPYSDFGVISAAYSLAGELKRANGMAWTSVWYGDLGQNSGGGGGLGGGQQGAGSGYQLMFKHEVGHALNLPHLGDATGVHQASVTGLLDPYMGDTASASATGGYLGGGFGKTTGYDALDNSLMRWGCSGTQVEAQDPMQRGCNNVATGRLFDHFSDFATRQMQRYWIGALGAQNDTLPYWSAFLSGSSAASPQATAFRLPQQEGRVSAEWGSAASSPSAIPVLRSLNRGTGQAEVLLRPPGDDGFIKALPTDAPAGSRYERFHDFRFPQQRNVRVLTVVGSFSYTNDATSAVMGVFPTRGNMMRLWDPSDTATFNRMRQSISGDTLWWGWNLHLKVDYADGSVRFVAMDYDVSAATDPMQGFSHWAVNLPDDGRALRRISLLYRPLCVRNSAASDRSCDIGLTANGITASNIYSGVQVAATWTP